MKKSLLIWLPLAAVLILAVVLIRAVTGGGNPAEIADQLAGQPAPALDVAMFAQEGGHEGQRLTNADIAGKPALVNFFASWCGPCAEENTVLIDMAKQHDVRIYGIAMKDDADALKAYLDKRGNPYNRVGLDDTGQTSIAWGVSGVPETFVLDAKGQVVERHAGALEPGDVQHILDLLNKAS
jgi:cytochrome c biogenesis protein CcmG/thiol:disulfide interchange protein DsbE